MHIIKFINYIFVKNIFIYKLQLIYKIFICI